MFYILKLEQLLWKTVWWFLKELKIELPGAVLCCAKLLQPCLTLCDLMDCSLQAPLSMGFSRQGYWSGLPCPHPGDLPDPGIEPASPALAGWFLTAWAKGSPTFEYLLVNHVFSTMSNCQEVAMILKVYRLLPRCPRKLFPWVKGLRRHSYRLHGFSVTVCGVWTLIWSG